MASNKWKGVLYYTNFVYSHTLILLFCNHLINYLLKPGKNSTQQNKNVAPNQTNSNRVFSYCRSRRPVNRTEQEQRKARNVPISYNFIIIYVLCFTFYRCMYNLNVFLIAFLPSSLLLLGDKIEVFFILLARFIQIWSILFILLLAL